MLPAGESCILGKGGTKNSPREIGYQHFSASRNHIFLSHLRRKACINDFCSKSQCTLATKLKNIVRFCHLWLGLVTGLIVFIMGVTGAIYCFQPELSRLTQSELSVEARAQSFLPISQLKSIAEKQLPGKKPSRILLKGKESAAIVQFFNKKKGYNYSVFLDPYTGAVLKTRDMNSEFFRFILNGHMYLWLPPDIGKPITGTSTLIFFVMVVSGIILWWPASKARRKSSYKVKWNASGKRLNYDLHNVFGFYASWVLIFVIITGLFWSFEWVGKSEFFLLSGGKSRPKNPAPLSVKLATSDSTPALDRIFNKVTAAYPLAAGYQIGMPQTDSAAILVRAYPDKNTFYRMDNLYFDQYSANEIPVHYYGKYADASAAEKAIRMNYDIHVGAIAGLPGRIGMFFVSLIAASLPVTGFLIWWGKKKKKAAKKPASLPRRAAVPELA
ncbi:PepSY-associated TM helix domain-containing protein [Pseudoflavitalea sp. G-6-1-2]|uniref:PepSY-associated TM helix domain-containing protein n=1 Tax=Pseudoflavitalea sp. G-6-1-2 TaxID=2728841 RepID=UPI003211E1D0